MLGATLGVPMRVGSSKRIKNLLSLGVVLTLSYRARLEKFIEFLEALGGGQQDWFRSGCLCSSCWAPFYTYVIGVVALLLLNNGEKLEATAASGQVDRTLRRTT